MRSPRFIKGSNAGVSEEPGPDRFLGIGWTASRQYPDGGIFGWPRLHGKPCPSLIPNAALTSSAATIWPPILAQTGHPRESRPSVSLTVDFCRASKMVRVNGTAAGYDRMRRRRIATAHRPGMSNRNAVGSGTAAVSSPFS